MSYEDFDPNDLLIQSYSTKPEGNFGPHRIPTGIRVIHLPTGTIVSCNEDRSQHKNRHTALTQLWAQVQGKPSYAELLSKFEVLRKALFEIRYSPDDRCSEIAANALDEVRANSFSEGDNWKEYAESIRREVR